jgi:NAD(P)-dependent dehydrogenase (short-subunit alcohol dehydrogenase family)
MDMGGPLQGETARIVVMTSPPFELLGQRALVTGGTRGIGAVTARALADAGAQVVVSARSTPTDSLFPVITANMSDPQDVQAFAASALERLGGIDIVVSNVGGQIRRPAWALDSTCSPVVEARSLT